MAEWFLNEARTAAKIRHPNGCPIHDVGQIDGVYYLAMALIEGQTLAAWMSEHTVDPLTACELLRKLASALSRLHEAGIVHRDIKASNVMIDESGEPLLMDFGLAGLTKDDGHSSSSTDELAQRLGGWNLSAWPDGRGGDHGAVSATVGSNQPAAGGI